MKKARIIALILAFGFVVAGGVLLALGLSFAEDTPPESALVQQEILIQDSFENIQINTKDCDVTFVPYRGDADAHIVIRTQERVHHSAQVADNTLRIEMQDERKWTDYIGIYTESMEMTVYLPESRYDSLHITTDTGDIKLPSPLSAKELLLRSNTGDIWCEGTVADSLDCMTDTGDITVRSGDAICINLHTVSGDMDISGVVAEELHLVTDTGETIAQDTTVQAFSFNGSTGDVELEDIWARDYLQVFTDSGDVQIDNSDAGTVNIETSTGDVSGQFLTPKWFDAHSNTGRVSVPQGREGGECRIQTDTGNIRFE